MMHFIPVCRSLCSGAIFFVFLEMELKGPSETLLSMYQTSHPFIKETYTFLKNQYLIFVAETPESMHEIDTRL
jgi:hypothetical protein